MYVLYFVSSHVAYGSDEWEGVTWWDEILHDHPNTSLWFVPGTMPED
jgi:hypothetical protein